jgi:hypothetical protein
LLVQRPTLVVEIVCALGEDLDAGILDFGRLACRPLEGPSLLDHHGATPLDLLLNRGRMQSAVDRKPEQTAAKAVTHASIIVVEDIAVIVSLDAAIRDYIEAGPLLIAGDGTNRVLESFAVD